MDRVTRTYAPTHFVGDREARLGPWWRRFYVAVTDQPIGREPSACLGLPWKELLDDDRLGAIISFFESIRRDP